jgi:HK97 gp10 family phage protein
MADLIITGGKELAEFLKTLPQKLERNVMRSALAAGARVIANEAKANAPAKSKRLIKSIRVSTDARKGVIEAYAKAGGKKAFYANFVEFGTAAHTITAKSGKMLKFTARDGNKVTIKEVLHTGAIAKPFLRPALDTKAPEAIRAIGSKIKERLTTQGLNAPSIEVSDN